MTTLIQKGILKFNIQFQQTKDNLTTNIYPKQSLQQTLYLMVKHWKHFPD